MKKRYKITISVFLILLSLLAIDYFIGHRQEKFLEERAALKKKLERLAWYSLKSDIMDIVYAKDRYRLTLSYSNPFPSDDLYLMTPSIRCFVQVGTVWKEVPLHDPAGKKEEISVSKLEKPLAIEKLIEVPFKNFEQVFPGYMHVRVNSIAYVASDAISKEDIAEKNEDFYIYLKPYYADDRELAKKFTFVNNIIPIWIPMPPH